MTTQQPDSRLRSLDALRGIDMFFIMGGGMIVCGLAACFPCPLLDSLARQMGHAPWGEGMRFEDLIFPMFLFIAGVSFPFSLSKQQQKGASNTKITLKIIRRGLTLVALGIIYNGLLGLDVDYANPRFASVLGRIGLAWMFGALIFLYTKKWHLRAAIALTLLLGYWALLSLVSAPDADGAGVFSPEGNIACYIDRLLLPGFLCGGNYDPEGLLSTLPAIATALLGMLTGSFVKAEHTVFSPAKKSLAMCCAAIALLGIAFAWDTVFPVNKYLWTSSFVCMAGGWSLLLFALFYYIIDVRGLRRWTLFFSVIGMNSITIYLAQEFINFGYTTRALFGWLIRLVPEQAEYLVYALGYTALCWLFLYLLHRLKIYLKV